MKALIGDGDRNFLFVKLYAVGFHFFAVANGARGNIGYTPANQFRLVETVFRSRLARERICDLGVERRLHSTYRTI